MLASSGNLLQWITISLLGVGVIMVSSASMSIGGEATTAASLLGRPVVYALIAVAVMFLISYVDIRQIYTQRGWTNPAAWLLILAVILSILALLPGFGRNVNGASRWLFLGPRSWNLSFQPSELAKWAMVLALAWWGARYAGAMRRFFAGVLPALAVLIVVCGLIVIEDLGTAVLIGSVGLMMLLAAGARVWQFALMIPPAIAAVVGMILVSPYRMQRVTTFMDPWADAQGSGYHLIQSLVTISGAGPTGWGLGNGPLKYGYVPEDTTDFLFAIICHELGIAGATLVIGLYLALMWVGLGIVRDCRHAFGRLLGLGIIATIGCQAIMNMAVVTGTVPTKGIALPLLSYGGTGWVMTAAALGLLAAIDRLNCLEAREEGEGDHQRADDLDDQPALA
ncbi:MAG: putative peptidoglycan glycosyltransferase FtsW [Phycisphaeraceae bacterium]